MISNLTPFAYRRNAVRSLLNQRNSLVVNVAVVEGDRSRDGQGRGFVGRELVVGVRTFNVRVSTAVSELVGERAENIGAIGRGNVPSQEAVGVEGVATTCRRESNEREQNEENSSFHSFL
jgi:hypothetical protein